MTLNQLQYIIALNNFRHFSTAADHCFVTQPTLSMQVQKLEEEFESENLETIQKLVGQNFGFTLLPYLAVKDLENNEKLSLVREFEQPIPKREVGLIHSKAFLKRHLISVLSDEIIKVIPKHLLQTENSLIVR